MRVFDVLNNPASLPRQPSSNVQPSISDTPIPLTCAALLPSMADPLSATASVVALVTVTVQSVKSLYETVSRFKGRDKTLQRLQDELQGIISVLDSLKEVAHAEASISTLLQGPIDRCSEVCQEFEQSMKSFNQKNKAGFRDWAKLEFMRGDINEFIDTISGYKSTIAVGLGTITMYVGIAVPELR
jgi:hypothetical protein